VNAGREKAVAEDLAAFGFHAFCPMEVEWRLKPRQQRGKGKPDRVKHERPLLSRYVFVGMGSGGPWRTVKLIDGVVDALKSDGRYWPVPSPAIDRMRAAYEAGDFDKTIVEAERLASELIGQHRQHRSAAHSPACAPPSWQRPRNTYERRDRCDGAQGDGEDADGRGSNLTSPPA
jgi:transcription antitermination factor NusG